MSTTQHTPGPWTAVESKTNRDFWEIESLHGDIAYITLQESSVGANAKLMAASPDLLSAAEYFSALCDSQRAPNIHEIEMLRAAIAKAKAES